MKIEIDINKFSNFLDRDSITAIKMIHVSQILLIIPYFFMFFLLMHNSSASKPVSEWIVIVSFFYAALFFPYLLIARKLAALQLVFFDSRRMEAIRRKHPEHSFKSAEQLCILQIQKQTNIFYAILDAYSLIGVIFLIVLIKTHVSMRDLRIWINILPLILTILHAAVNFPNENRILNIFTKNFTCGK